MNRFFLWLLIIACLYAMGAFTLLVAGWLDRWPSVKATRLVPESRSVALATAAIPASPICTSTLSVRVPKLSP